ncbi:anoctamin-5-like [Asbolus verrucosus]|uniref:Anoctamin n=1 Tax=Asbolus verrucosus TaxID=1661398 RepID=A0A482VNF0_ASBVE|nr:anoctamin-5-like [Asbolus verrucosus]
MIDNNTEKGMEIPQLSTQPEEDKEASLPKTCYFNDGKTKVDYVIVYPKLEEHVRGDQMELHINKFTSGLKEKGLLVEKEVGKFYDKFVFLKIHAPHKLLLRFAKVFNVELACNNPYHKFWESVYSRCLATHVTKLNSNSKIYSRAPKTLSGERPTEITTAERSLIVYRLLQSIKFIINGDEIDIKRLLRQEIFLHAYPIHDGDYLWTDSGPLSDRQLLCKYWANLKYVFTIQPVHLVERYYGPKVAFYFALQSFYNKLLIIPAVIGVITTMAGIISLFLEVPHIKEEVCESKIVLCSDQYMKTACGLMKLAYVIDNPMTIFYVVVCSCWGAAFWNLWQRRQAILRLRWNLTAVKADRTMRREFQENAKTRRSSITGEIEYYVPGFKKALYFIFTYTIVFMMVMFPCFNFLCVNVAALQLIIFVLIVFLIVQYRFILRERLDYDETRHANEIELFSSTIITTLIILILNGCAPVLLKFYSAIIRFLTAMRLPRTQSQFNRMYLHKMFIIQFANFFTPLFYLAYFKGFFFTYPGDVSEWTIIKNIQLDLCSPAGCLVDLGMQLISLMVIKAIFKFCFDFIKYITSRWHGIRIPEGPGTENLGQWEKEYSLYELNHSALNGLYVDLVIQYSFITFFNASLPLIGLIALIHNMLKVHYDANRFIKYYRRPVAEKVAGLEGWNQILRVITIFGTISNAFVVAFRTDFVLRMLYRSRRGSLKGFVNSTLSEFALEDYKGTMIDHVENITSCFYRGFRHPPTYPKKYSPTKEFWHQVAVRALYFIALENFSLLLSLFLSFVIPQIPRKVKVKVEHDMKLLREAREASLEEHSKSFSVDKKDSKSARRKLPINDESPPVQKSVDFILVYLKKSQNDDSYSKLVTFITNLEQKGFELESAEFSLNENINFIKIHVPRNVLLHFAEIFGVELAFQNIEFKPVPPRPCKFMANELTMPQFSGPIYRRASATITGAQPKDITNAEKGLIIYKVLTINAFGEEKQEYGIDKLLRTQVFESAYPLHDGPFEWTEEGPLNDRQLLKKYWSSMKCWYKQQPLDLIERYYGPETAFYFAWLGFYNKMLIPASAIGFLCFLLGTLIFIPSFDQRIREVCDSGIFLCPRCLVEHCKYDQLKNSCFHAYLLHFFDNPLVVTFAALMSIWSTIFLELWRREEAMLQIRWNLCSTESDFSMRPEFEEHATHHKYSKISGTMEPYMPKRVLCYRYTITAAVILLLVFIAKLTQVDFDNSYTYKSYAIAFVNNYSVIFYIAFMKARFYTYPGDKKLWKKMGGLGSDLCDPAGCIIELGIQMVIILLAKNLIMTARQYIVPQMLIFLNKFRKRKAKDVRIINQWESDYLLNTVFKYHLMQEYMQMIIQYGFVTFFVAAFPLAPLLALFNNIIELRVDAFKFTSAYRRTIAHKVANIAAWNGILQGVTYIGVATNAFVIAFTSELVQRTIYETKINSSLVGFVNYSLSAYNTSEFPLTYESYLNISVCYYPGKRYPPDHPQRYQLTDVHWYELTLKFLAVVVFEHVVMLITGVIAYAIPDIPFSVKEHISHHRDQLKEMKLKALHDSYLKEQRMEKSDIFAEIQ